ncbi:ABC transporter substrate-binding protein [Actinophytocola sp.]|uniref:ABC transporter substrate-binding protein n=1 Tax=Actinophytocola sp. TaxID=1872138 RepID=UPI003D6B29BF
MLRRTLAIMLAGLLLAAGCSSDDGNGAGGADGAEPGTVEVSIGINRNLLFLPVWVAEEQAFFAKHGVDASLDEVGLGPALRTALLSRTVDMIAQSPEGSALLWEQGETVVNLVATQGKLSWQLILRPGLEGQVTPGDYEDLRGLRLAMVAQATGPDYYLQALLREHGLEPGKDVTLVGQGADFASGLALLDRGEIDGMMTVEPATSQGINDHDAFSFINFGTDETFQNAGEVPMAAVASLGSYLEENEDAARRVVAAVVDAMNYISENPKEVAAYAAELTGLPVEVASGIIDRELVDNRAAISKEGWDALTKALRDGGLEKRAPYESVVATQLADAWDEYGADGS